MLHVHYLLPTWHSKEAAAVWAHKKTPPPPAIINECLNGHAYESHPVTREFHAIKQHCALCDAPLRTVRIVGNPSHSESAHRAPAIGAPEWTRDPPTCSGWYWYYEAGKNRDRPMKAFVFQTRAIQYVSRFATHEPQSFRDPHRLQECSGSWWRGPESLPPSR
jgi:hypothetical protein